MNKADITRLELTQNILTTLLICQLSTHPLIVNIPQGPKAIPYAQIAGTKAGTRRKTQPRLPPRETQSPTPNSHVPIV